MTTLDQLRSALERVENATGPDREIDEAIASLLGWQKQGPWWIRPRPNPCSFYLLPPKWSASLDAVVALVEREYWPAKVEPLLKEAMAEVDIQYGSNRWDGLLYSQKLVFALLAAFLRARIAAEMEAEAVA